MSSSILQRLWLIFAQTVTVCLATLFVILTLRPDWLSRRELLLVAPTPSLSQPADGSSPQSTTASVSSASQTGAMLSLRSAAEAAGPAVVNIYTAQQTRSQRSPFSEDPLFRRFFGERFGQQRRESTSSLGSGVIVSTDGYILTNHHVVEAAEQIEVALADGRKAEARVIGADPDTDLAIVKIGLDKLPAIRFGSPQSAKVGDLVLAIGNPFGVGQTVTMGIISATGRNQLGINTFENFIQTDAAINPGNSGGALVDSQGALLGINTAIYSRSGGSLGIGFAIPADTARQVMDSLVATGQVTRGYIGVEPQDLTPEIAQAFKLPRQEGAVIAGVLRDGPADKAGIKTGDILVAVNGKTITNTAVMLNTVAQLTPGSQAKLTVIREGKETLLDVTVGKRPKPRQQRPD